MMTETSQLIISFSVGAVIGISLVWAGILRAASRHRQLMEHNADD